MSDLISRDDAYEVLSDYYHHTTDVQHEALKEALDRVPSEEPKKGKWEGSDDPWKAVCSFSPCKTAICSVCKLDTFDRIDYAKKHYKFCPYCGAKMEGGDA